MSTEEHLTELNEAARRAGFIVTEQIESIIERAEREAVTIRRDARRDAEDMRREAADAAKRLLDRLHALEFPLGELVVSLRDEVDRVTQELERGEHVDSHATSLPPPQGRSDGDDQPEDFDERAEPRVSAAPIPSPAPDGQGSGTSEFHGHRIDADVDYPPEPEAEETDPARTEQPIPAGVVQEALRPEENGGKAGRRARRRQKSRQAKGLFITVEGFCSICRRSFAAGSEEELEASGWRVSHDVGLCPSCQADGWQLPDGARLPVRPGGR